MCPSSTRRMIRLVVLTACLLNAAVVLADEVVLRVGGVVDKALEVRLAEQAARESR